MEVSRLETPCMAGCVARPVRHGCMHLGPDLTESCVVLVRVSMELSTCPSSAPDMMYVLQPPVSCSAKGRARLAGWNWMESAGVFPYHATALHLAQSPFDGPALHAVNSSVAPFLPQG